MHWTPTGCGDTPQLLKSYDSLHALLPPAFASDHWRCVLWKPTTQQPRAGVWGRNLLSDTTEKTKGTQPSITDDAPSHKNSPQSFPHQKQGPPHRHGFRLHMHHPLLIQSGGPDENKDRKEVRAFTQTVLTFTFLRFGCGSRYNARLRNV